MGSFGIILQLYKAQKIVLTTVKLSYKAKLFGDFKMSKFINILYQSLSIFYFLLGVGGLIFFDDIPLELVNFIVNSLAKFPIFQAAMEYGHNAERTLVLLFYSIAYPSLLSILFILFYFNDIKTIYYKKSITRYQALGGYILYIFIYSIWFYTKEVNSKEDLVFLGGGYISYFFILFLGYLQPNANALLCYAIYLSFKKLSL